MNTLPLAFRVPELPDGAANPLYLPHPVGNDGTNPRVPLEAGVNDGGQLQAFHLDYRQRPGIRTSSTRRHPDPGFGRPQTGLSQSGATHARLSSSTMT